MRSSNIARENELETVIMDTPIEEPVRNFDPAQFFFSEGESGISHQCEQCSTDSDVSFCNVCEAVFCAKCREEQILHKRQKMDFHGIPHEKTLASVARKVQSILKPPRDQSIQEELHRRDAEMAWFGVFRPSDVSPVFQDYGRFNDLMRMTEEQTTSPLVQSIESPDRDVRTPSLVSFVGETRAGKSIVIKLLIELNTESHQKYTTPVVGVSGSDVPTSEDVHLYLEPQTAYTHTPVLFADCEGLTGGTREPMGAIFKKKHRKAGAEASAKDRPTVPKISEREISWADSALRRSRKFAVTNFYPRLLHTFSDVVVFVLREARSDLLIRHEIAVADYLLV